MYWLASYPRSGNTFLRILFKEVYGIHTWEGYGKESPQAILKKDNQAQIIVIKTHELPSKTAIDHKKLKTIYLVRDGRDAAVSMAYHRCQIVKPGSDYNFNLLSNTLSPLNTSFGGWSRHVRQWQKNADVIIKFEDLIKDPIKQLKRLESLMNLPAGDYDKIPTFKDLQTKKYAFGSGKNSLSREKQKDIRQKFFRSGQTKTWQDHMPKTIQDVFMHKHGDMLIKLGYTDVHKRSFVLVKVATLYIQWLLGLLKDYMRKKP